MHCSPGCVSSAEIPRGYQTIRTLCIFHCSDDRFGNDLRGQTSNQILVCLYISHGHGIDAVAVSGCVDGIDGSGIAVVRHARDLAQLGFFEFRIGHDDGKRRVSGKLILHCLYGGHHIFRRAAQSGLILREQSGDPGTGLPVKTPTEREEFLTEVFSVM